MPIISLNPFAIGTDVVSGTSGSVLFVSTTGKVSQDNASFSFNDATNVLTITNISGTTLQSSTANTPATASNSTAIATTAFVQTNLGSYIPMTSGANFASLALANTFTNFNTFRDIRFAANNLYNIGTTTVRPSGLYVGASGIDSIGSINTSGNMTVGGTFTGFANLSGNSTATTQTLGTNNTTIATTAFVRTYVSASGGGGGGGDAYLANTQTFTGANTFSLTPTSSSSVLALTGTVFTGGTASTTLPMLRISDSGVASTNWQTTGTYIGINAKSTFTGRLIDTMVNNVSQFYVGYDGAGTFAGNLATQGNLSCNGTFTASSTSLLVGAASIQAAGAASTSPLRLFGSLYTGGTSTTTFPMLRMEPNGTTAVTTWSTNGTFLGVNAANGFNGNFIDFHVTGGTSRFNVTASGNVNANDIISSGTISGFANLTGNSTAVTQTLGTNNTTIATTAFVRTYVSASGGGGGGGDVYLANANAFANAGNTVPTPSSAMSNTVIANTDFVKSAISGARTGSLGFAFPSGTLIAGMQSLPIMCPTGRTIRGITLLGEGSGSVSIDIWRVGYGSYPMGSANTIFTGTNRAVITSGNKNRDATLSGLISSTINRFDTLKAVVSSVSASGLYGVTVVLDTFVE